jgi:serine/threonine-protein kinase
MDQLLDVLAVAHDLAIVHRDVKPENVFVTTGGQVKILDFGIARLYEAASPDHSQTVAGLPMGSPAFMSPEQARGRWDLVDAQSDLWSVGATMFALLSGQDVHVADTVPELLAAIFTEPAPSLATVMPGCHAAMVDVVDRALQLHLADRWQDARAMREAVREAYAVIYGEELPASNRTTPTPRQPPRVSVPGKETGGRRAATVTALAVDVPRRRIARRAALASAFLLAAALGIAGARAEWAPPPVHLAVPPTDLLQVDAPPRPATTPAPPSTPDVPVAQPTPAARAVSSAAPTVRGHHRSVYDRRN